MYVGTFAVTLPLFPLFACIFMDPPPPPLGANVIIECPLIKRLQLDAHQCEKSNRYPFR